MSTIDEQPNPSQSVAPIAESVIAERSNLRWLWWLLGAVVLAVAIFGIVHTLRTSNEVIAEPSVGAPSQSVGICDASESNPVTLNFRWWGGDARQARQLEAIARFEESHSFITINPEPTSMDGYFDALGVQMAAGTEPDIFALGGSWPLDYGRAGTLLALDNNAAIDIAPFNPATLVDATVDGRVYAVPTGGNATALVVNPRIFEEAGVELPDDDTWTWEEFVNIANEITAHTPEGVYGVEMRPETIIGSFTAQRDGIGLYTVDGELQVEPQTLADYFQIIQDLTAGGGMPPAAAMSELSAVGPEETLMGRGLGAMMFATSNQIGAFQESSGDELRLLRIPGESEFDSVGVAVLPSQWLAVGASSNHAGCAAVFVDWMVNSADAAEIMGVDRGNPLNAVVAEAIAPSLTPVEEEQVNYMARISSHAGQAIAQPPGAGEQPTISISSQAEAAFGRMTPMQAAESWISRMQSELAAAS